MGLKNDDDDGDPLFVILTFFCCHSFPRVNTVTAFLTPVTTALTITP